MTNRSRGRDAAAATDAATKYRRRLFAREGLRRTLSELRADHPSLGQRMMPTMLGIPALRRFLLGTPFPQRYDRIGRSAAFLPNPPLEAGLRWEVHILTSHPRQLNEFLRLRKEFETFLFRAEHERARTILEQVLKSLGCSLWTLAAEILLADLDGGLEANKTLRRDLLEQMHGLPRVLAHCFSLRAERQVPAATYEAAIQDLARTATDPYATAFLFRSAFYSVRTISEDTLGELLSDGPAYPIVDRYVALVRVLTLLAARTHPPPPDYLGELISELNAAIIDPFLPVAGRLLGAPIPIQNGLNPTLMPILDLYTRGDYEQSMLLAKAASDADPTRFEYHEIRARSSLHLADPPVSPTDSVPSASHLWLHVKGVLRNDATTSLSTQALHKFAYTYDGTGLAQQAAAFVMRNTSSSLPVDPLLFEAFSASALTPRSANGFRDPQEATSFLADLATVSPDNRSVALFGALLATPPEPTLLTALRLPLHRQLKYAGAMLERSGRHSEGARSYEALSALASSSPLAQIEAQIGLYQCSLQTAQYDRCRQLVVDAYVVRGCILPGADLARLISMHPLAAIDAQHADITLPLLYHIAHQEGVPGIDARTVFESLEAFLEARGAVRPSQLGTDADPFRREHLVCLLRYVCVQEVLDHSVVYESTEDLERERIDVCHVLRTLDPDHETLYAREVGRLSTAASIRTTLQTVGRSKVHADTDGILQSLDASFHQQFARYNLLRRLDTDLLTDVSESLGPAGVVLITRETTTVFSVLFNDIKARFISSNAHGLDSYLSVRIRHGTLSGQIRSVFERQHLLTRRVGTAGGYHPNEHWRHRLREYGWVGPTVDEAFTRFAETVDATIDDVRDRWIQIRGEANDNQGLFDFDYSADALLLLQVATAPAESPVEFIDAVFAELWARTEHNLVAVRDAVTRRLAGRLTGCLDNLVDDIAACAPPTALPELRAAVAMSRTELSNTLADVAEWFTLGGGTAPPDFSIQAALDASVAVMRRTFSTHTFAPAIDVTDNVVLRGRCLPHVLDVLYILFENVIKHALSDPMEVSVHASVDCARLWVVVTNRLASDVDLGRLKEQAKELRVHANEGARRAVIRREGGSGYYKLGKILTHDLKCTDWALDVAVSDPASFAVRIGLNLSEVRA